MSKLWKVKKIKKIFLNLPKSTKNEFLESLEQKPSYKTRVIKLKVRWGVLRIWMSCSMGLTTRIIWVWLIWNLFNTVFHTPGNNYVTQISSMSERSVASQLELTSFKNPANEIYVSYFMVRVKENLQWVKIGFILEICCIYCLPSLLLLNPINLYDVIKFLNAI